VAALLAFDHEAYKDQIAMAVLTHRHRAAASECRTAEMARQRTKSVHREFGSPEAVSAAGIRFNEREFARHFRRLCRTI
jgi:hypothetical protein